MLIVIEGIDGCGKTTQADLLSRRIGWPVFAFPRKTGPYGEAIQELMQKDDATPTEIQALQGLMLMDKYAASKEFEDRTTLTHQPSNAILARYWQSGVVYPVAEGMDKDALMLAHSRLPMGDINILIDVPLHASSNRKVLCDDRFERNTLLLQKVRRGYLELWDEMGGKGNVRKWVVVNGGDGKTRDEVHQAIVTEVLRHCLR